MNNIEILEKMLNTTRKNKRGNREIKFEVNSNYYKALENLIQENKELKKQIPSPTNPIPIEYQTDIWVLKRDYIPKSKVKEKIEHFKECYNSLSKNPKEHLHSKTEYLIVIGELESLLEEGE